MTRLCKCNNTYYPFVQSKWSLNEPLTHVVKPLGELQAGDLKLLQAVGNSGITLRTTKLPELDGDSYALTIKLYFDTGKTSSYTFAMSAEPSVRLNEETNRL